MLFSEYSRPKALLSISALNRNNGLSDKRTGIYFRCNEVDGTAVLVIPGFKRPAVGVESRVLGEERRVDVDNLPEVLFDEARLNDLHEAGEYEELRRWFARSLIDSLLLLSKRAEVFPSKICRIYPLLTGKCEPGCVGLVTHNPHDRKVLLVRCQTLKI